ncbi:MAG: FKBP-type peptidyl-prolyl cis-trans isomerase [Candidatus Zixiibacteriota bacterium]
MLAVAIFSGLVVIAGCAKKEAAPPAESQTPATQPPAEPAQAMAPGIPQVSGDTVTTPSGLKYIEMTVGTGATPQTGQMVLAHYTGWLTDGTKFDSSRDRGQPFPFPLGQGRVIKGWDEGLATMKVGGRRLLIIPPDLGYGARGAGGVIPPGATLVFDVELVGIQDAAVGG